MIRVGSSFDAHAFDEARPLVLGGVTIEGSAGLAGHSDADVVCHVVAEALLGAAKLGDLGTYFPATGDWLGASSIDILAQTGNFVVDAGWRVGNADVMVMAQRPKLAPHIEAMSENVSKALDVDEGVISIKATTTDGMGFVGRAEGIAALATVLIER